MSPDALTPGARDVYSAILVFMGANGIAPTVRDIMFILGGRSTSAVRYQLVKLKDAGYITFEYRRARTIKLLDHPMGRAA